MLAQICHLYKAFCWNIQILVVCETFVWFIIRSMSQLGCLCKWEPNVINLDYWIHFWNRWNISICRDCIRMWYFSFTVDTVSHHMTFFINTLHVVLQAEQTHTLTVRNSFVTAKYKFILKNMSGLQVWYANYTVKSVTATVTYTYFWTIVLHTNLFWQEPGTFVWYQKKEGKKDKCDKFLYPVHLHCWKLKAHQPHRRLK